jgi:hypothetical protein
MVLLWIAAVQHLAVDSEIPDLLEFVKPMYRGQKVRVLGYSGSFSWILCLPGRKQLVLNADPVDGWYRCQSSLCSKAPAAIASLTLYVEDIM